MRINPAKLTLEDFPDQRDWIGKMFSVLNTFTGDLVRAFSNQISVEDNLFQEIKEIKWINSSNEFPLKFKTKFSTAPKGLSVIYLYNNTLSAYSTSAPWVQWGFQDGQVLISAISGLTAASQYTIRLHLVYG